MVRNSIKEILTLPIIVSAIIALLLLTAIARNPYNYYIFLRWITFIASVYLAYKTFNYEPKGWFATFVFLAILFNPIIPIFFKKDIWTFLDLGGAAYFLIASFTIKTFRRKTN